MLLLRLAMLLAPVTWTLAYIAINIFNLNIQSTIYLFLFEFIMVTSVFIIISFFRFFRDPDRISPEALNILVSPADGTIRYIKQCHEGKIPVSQKGTKKILLKELLQTTLLKGDLIMIGIEMSLLDVHVNRSPISGMILFQHYKKGNFYSLRNPIYLENERVITIIENPEKRVAVVQIASRLVRRIVSYHKTGDSLNIGERLGMIRFGSQVDLLISSKDLLNLKIKVGDHVHAGESIIGTFSP